jgi:hypothetical protein
MRKHRETVAATVVLLFFLPAAHPEAVFMQRPRHFAFGRVEDGRGSLGHSATLRFPTPLVEPEVPISGIRLSDWLHRQHHRHRDARKRLMLVVHELSIGVRPVYRPPVCPPRRLRRSGSLTAPPDASHFDIGCELGPLSGEIRERRFNDRARRLCCYLDTVRRASPAFVWITEHRLPHSACRPRETHIRSAPCRPVANCPILFSLAPFPSPPSSRHSSGRNSTERPIEKPRLEVRPPTPAGRSIASTWSIRKRKSARGTAS